MTYAEIKADFACTWGTDAPPGGYSTSTAISDFPGRFGIACSKFGFTTSPGPCAPALALAKIAAVAQNAAKAGRMIMAKSLQMTRRMVVTDTGVDILYQRWC